MMKVVLASLSLALFSLSSILFQVSGVEEAIAGNREAQNGFLYSITVDGDWQYWMANTDGKNHQQIRIVLPRRLKLAGACRLTPDEEVLIFPVYNPSTMEYFVYSMSLDGSDVKKLVDVSPGTQLEINQVF